MGVILTKTWRGVLLAVCACAGLALAVGSCGDDGGGPRLSAAELNESGWEDCALGEYNEALSSFEEALSLEDGLVEARLGWAWCKAYLGDYSASVSGYDEVIDSGEFVTDAFAGRAAAALEIPDYAGAIASADSALARDPGYRFGRQPAYDFGDLRLILAQSHFALAQYESAQDQVDIIDPSNRLDPESSATWVVGGVTYSTYEAALAAIIEFLWALEGGL
jgi:tetratricopeptide (TPR) repeat protein